VQVDARILVPGEADVAQLARCARLDQRGVRAFAIEHAVRIFEADHLVVLDQIDAVGLQAVERLVQLPRRLLLRAAVDLGHQEHLVAIPVGERLAHADLARAVVVVPGVVHERDAAIDRVTNDAKAERLVDGRYSEVPASETDRGDPFARVSEQAVRDRVSGVLKHRALPGGCYFPLDVNAAQ